MEPRGVGASERVLKRHATDPFCSRSELQLAAWQLGRAGQPLPTLPSRTDELGAQLIWLLGSGDIDAAIELIDRNAATKEGELLIIDACGFGGLTWPDPLVDVAHRHPDREFSGSMLASTSNPDRLLALFDNQRILVHGMETIGELIIRGRDRGEPCQLAEQRWQRDVMEKPPPRAGFFYIPRPSLFFLSRETWLRIRAREDLEEAFLLLDEYDTTYGRDAVPLGGVRAVLGRLIKTDPQRVVDFVARGESIDDKIDWLTALIHRSLPVQAEPLVDQLIRESNLHEAQFLASRLVGADQPERMAMLLPAIAAAEPKRAAALLSSGLYRLRLRGMHDQADRAREQLLPVLTPEARDMLDVRSCADVALETAWGIADLP